MAAPLLTRSPVRADNSCLFTAISRLAEGITDELPLKTAGRKLRGVCAELAAADPDPATRALLLGHDSIEAYGVWIRNEHHWGGEPEIVMLANHFGLELVVCSCESLSFLRYTPDVASTGACRRAYLLYTGQHYDPLVGVDGTVVFDPEGESAAALDESALVLARAHNADAARRASERRVSRIKCCGCGAIVDDAAAFQEHCTAVEHDDDFAYDCEQVELVLAADEALPVGAVDLSDTASVFAFYNAQEPTAISLSMRCTAAPFELRGVRYESLEHCWRALEDRALDERRRALGEAVEAMYRTEAAATSGLRAALLATAPKTIVCVDIDPWLGMQAAGGISAGQNGMGKALMATRDALLRDDAE